MSGMNRMKAVLLAGGSGTRLLPMTKGVNKHLLPIRNQPMILYPLLKLVEFGIQDVLLITGPDHLTQFAHLLGDGSEWGARIYFCVQPKPGGIAQALGLARSFVGPDSFFVILGDNIFEDSLLKMQSHFPLQPDEALVVLKEVSDPERFGIAELKQGRIIDVVEKPKKPKSNLCVTGIYAYTPMVFEVIREIKPSGRGEMEISDVNRFYAQAGKLKYHELDGWWGDCGTPESLWAIGELLQTKEMS